MIPHASALRLVFALATLAVAAPALGQSQLPLRDYGYDRRYHKDETIRGGSQTYYGRSGRSGLGEDGARRNADRLQGARRGDSLDLRTRPFDDKGAPLGSRPSIDGARPRSFSD
ncbi:hypothetical protein NK718_16765 [Alsobacter sp. SYSU M60028]|uniref:Secreted protein n=1 Tax=Alsobacter ponti TaxID=2962936 RepID=A0ABT1LGH5_9HYPH|nr:hypothetical protein [Alsobacter ponti]MCP8940181.1 hypothetical protein [Alsobacter ponti]